MIILSNTIGKKHLLVDNVLYYISNADSESVLRLYVPTHLRGEVVFNTMTITGTLAQIRSMMRSDLNSIGLTSIKKCTHMCQSVLCVRPAAYKKSNHRCKRQILLHTRS